MTAFFPNIHLQALSKFAAEAAAAEHPVRQVRGSQPQYVKPRVVRMQDVQWAGEKMIMISFDPSTVPLGPHSMLAYFPSGRHRLTTQAIIGMTAAVRRRRADLAPKIYAYKDYVTGDCLLTDPASRAVADVGRNDIGAEVVLLEKVAGDCLETIWPRLSAEQQELVCVKLVDILLNLYYSRGSHIGTDLQGTHVNTRCDRPQDLNVPVGELPPHISGSILMTRALEDGPLADMPLPSAVCTPDEYLGTLASRIERVFDSDPISNVKGRNSGWFRASPMTDHEILQARETWNRLKRLIPFHTGGFYLPAHLTVEKRIQAYTILRCPHFGIYHSDMKMCRFLVSYVSTTPTSEQDIVLRLATGWEHAYRAPAWSCARLPLWLDSIPFPLNQTITFERRRELRNFIHAHLNKPEMLEFSHDWICSWVFGILERWFEGVLSAHWAMQPTVEVCISRLKSFWEGIRPDVRFPLEVTRAGAVPQEDASQDFARGQSLIMDSVNALARASGTTPEDWCLAMQSGQFPNAG